MRCLTCAIQYIFTVASSSALLPCSILYTAHIPQQNMCRTWKERVCTNMTNIQINSNNVLRDTIVQRATHNTRIAWRRRPFFIAYCDFMQFNMTQYRSDSFSTSSWSTLPYANIGINEWPLPQFQCNKLTRTRTRSSWRNHDILRWA